MLCLSSLPSQQKIRDKRHVLGSSTRRYCSASSGNCHGLLRYLRLWASGLDLIGHGNRETVFNRCSSVTRRTSQRPMIELRKVTGTLLCIRPQNNQFGPVDVYVKLGACFLAVGLISDLMPTHNCTGRCWWSSRERSSYPRRESMHVYQM